MRDKRIPLRNAKGETVAEARVDAADAERFGCWRWQFGSNGYAARTCKKRGKVYLHREILGLEKGDERVADHINRDRLDCRRSNLRIVTVGENNQNCTTWSTSGVRGVSWHKMTGKWRVHVTVRGKYHHGGMFSRIEDAEARAIELRKMLLTHTVEQ